MSGDLFDAVDGLASMLEAAADDRAKRKTKLRRRVDVAAYGTITARGALRDPVAIAAGDTLYLSPVEQPGAGLVTRDVTRTPYAVAAAAVAAGARATIAVLVYEKIWLTAGAPCEICDENALAGWIPMDEEFPSGDLEPQAHPNCNCSLDTRRFDD
jgi:precorrin-6B methylase 1